MSGSKLITPALLVLMSAIVLSARTTDVRSPQSPAPPESDYRGSASCQRCHAEQYASWEKALHLKMTRPAGASQIVGDFRPGTRFEKYGRAYAMSSRDGRRFITITRRGAEPETFEVHYTLGARRFQGYLSRLADGRIYVLPAFWHVETSQWIDFKEITPLPDADHDFRQIWNVNCFNCHATNLAQNFDARSLSYNTTWAEMGIGCEACHGPGSRHIALMNEWEQTPPAVKSKDIFIFSQRSAPRRQIFDACGYCHGNKNNYFVGFKPGDRYEDYALPFLISQPIPPEDPQGDYWPDGRPNRFNRPQALTTSGCFMKGQATCTDCHLAHGARNDHALKLPVTRSNGLCTQCHRPLAEAAALQAHTRHASGSSGSRCVDCHMSDVNWRLLTRRRDHTFEPPVPELTARYGVPNACTTCHDDKSPEWAAATMTGWYGDRDRARRADMVQLADAMYAAGSNDTRAVAPLASLVIDTSRGILIRASAAEFLGRLMALPGAKNDSALNALIRATTDSEGVVRARATSALARIGDRRSVPFLAARLKDPARVVRVLAASGLLDLGVTVLPGPPQQAFAAAQQEYEESLRTFPDSAANQLALGVLLARRGDYDQAVKEWEQGRRLDPGDPRFAALIAEAKRR